MTWRVFIGYDSRETAAYHVCAHSIQRHARTPVSITPLDRRQLGRWYSRTDAQSATEFSLTRFLVPFLSGFDGVSVFLDCDMLLRTGIEELFAYALADPDKAVHVVQHDYTPKSGTKFLGQANAAYPRKNWSSVIVFRNARCRALTPEYVNAETPAALHRFTWIADSEIGALPLAWNWLIGEYPPNNEAKLLHYTLGTPCFNEYRECDHALEWWRELAGMTEPARSTLARWEAERAAMSADARLVS